MPKHPSLNLLLALACALLPLGCGGSGPGGAGSPTPALFSGWYDWHSLWLKSEPSPLAIALFGRVHSDGNGTMDDGTLQFNRDGTLGGGGLTGSVGPYAYTIGAGRRTTLLFDEEVWQGGCSATGDLLSLCHLEPGGLPAIAVLGRRVAGVAGADLVGEWHAAAFLATSADERAWWGGTVNLLGTGAVLASVGLNTNGAVTAPAPPAAYGTWTSTAAGVFTWDTPAGTLVGTLVAEGEAILLSGATTSHPLEMMAVLIRKGSGLGNGTLRGTYHAVGLLADTSPRNAFGAVTMTADADGTGTWSFDAQSGNLDGVITTSLPGPSTGYAVAPDGRFADGAGDLLGGIAPSGNIAVLGGTTTGGSSPRFLVLHR
jgi:hypothetical protein